MEEILTLSRHSKPKASQASIYAAYHSISTKHCIHFYLTHLCQNLYSTEIIIREEPFQVWSP